MLPSLFVRSRTELLLLTALLGACGRIGFDSPRELADAGAADAPVSCTWGPFSTPELIPETDTAAREWAPSISPDELELYFSRDEATVNLYRATRPTRTSTWTTVAAVPELATTSPEEDDPTVASDGLEIFYGKDNVLRAARTSTAAPFGPGVVVVANTTMMPSNKGPELSRDDLSLYFMSEPPGASELYVMQRPSRQQAFGAPTLLALDPLGQPGFPTISADGLELLFSSIHGAERDLWRVQRATTADPFGPPTRVDELSAVGEDDWDPELSADGKSVWFARYRGVATGVDLMTATRACL